jgi:DNA processing protein
MALLKRLLDRFPDPVEALAAPILELRTLGFDEDRAAELGSPGLRDRAEKEFDRVVEKGYSLLTFGDVEYPSLLGEIFDPPCVLYCAGRRDALEGPAVAVVGSRHPTPYGRAVAARLAEDLASRGLVIVSGLAVGIDTAGHEGALKGGRTVAVLGSGLENMYPRENRKLFGAIVEAGAVVSEFPLDTDPFAGNFPRRNRVISGLSRAVIVVEAARRSGSLISARMALDQDREVMAVPGNVTSEMSRGTHWLLKAGAKLVEDWEDVAEELPSPLREALLATRKGETRPLPLLTEEEAAVLARLKPDEPVSVDALVEESGRTVSELLGTLLALEIKGVATQRPGKLYLRSW